MAYRSSSRYLIVLFVAALLVGVTVILACGPAGRRAGGAGGPGRKAAGPDRTYAHSNADTRDIL